MGLRQGALSEQNEKESLRTRGSVGFYSRYFAGGLPGLGGRRGRRPGVFGGDPPVMTPGVSAGGTACGASSGRQMARTVRWSEEQDDVLR